QPYLPISSGDAGQRAFTDAPITTPNSLRKSGTPNVDGCAIGSYDWSHPPMANCAESNSTFILVGATTSLKRLPPFSHERSGSFTVCSPITSRDPPSLTYCQMRSSCPGSHGLPRNMSTSASAQ